MYLNRNGEEVTKPVECVNVDNILKLKKSFVVRLIKKTMYRKEVVGEEHYTNYPTEKQIMFCLAKYPDTFAAVEEIYVLEDECPLPFS